MENKVPKSIFLDPSILNVNKEDAVRKIDMQRNRIRFEFPLGFTTLRLIEECRALNALDMSNPDNFDLMYDMMMQMLVGKTVVIHYMEDTGKVTQIAAFAVTDRYMNMRGVDIIDEYPVLVNWMVEYIAAFLAKKYPRSLKDIQAVMSERKELMKKQSLKKPDVRMGL